MADIRIKDLTTLESASLTGDVFVIDGTTGTRKLSAFSPTFGGNATVTGTLNVNGTGLSQMVGNANTRLEVGNSIEDQRAHIGLVQRLNLGNPIFSKNLAGKSASDAYTTIATTPASGYSGIECGYGGVIRLLNGTGATTAGAEVTPVNVLDTTTTRVAIPLTTASTTTSSGALIVSGGVGVGGNVTVGGQVDLNSGTAAAPSLKLNGTNNGIYYTGSNIVRIAANATEAATFSATAATFAGNVTISGSNGYAVIGGRQWSFRANSSGGSPASGCVIRDDSAAADRLTIDINGNIVLSPASVAASGEVGNLRIADSSNTNRKLFFGLDNTVSPNGVGYIQSTLTGTTTIPLQLQPLGGSLSVGNSGTVVTLNGTTASTSTSSGALVVSGGVGVAGAINAGDQIKSERTSGTDTASAVLGVLTTTGAGVTNSFGIDARVIVNNSSGTTTSATGLRALSRVSNVSTVTQAVAMLAQVDNPGGGTITTAYGLYVNPITAGGTNYAIYTGGGRINFQSLPTSSAGLAAGTIWNDGGTLKVA